MCSGHKGTRAIIECWANRPDFPRLDLYTMDGGAIDRYNELFHFVKENSRNLKLHHGVDINPAAFGKLVAEASFILCPSNMEGFGHYINQARAAGALVLSTDAPPMNELIDNTSGVLVRIDGISNGGKQLLGADFTGSHGLENAPYLQYRVHGAYICEGVDKILALTPYERKHRAINGHKRYLEQLKFFRRKMFEFATILRSDF